MLDVSGLKKSYASVPILGGIDLSLSPGQTIAITGESGSGKSTILHLIAGLDTPDAGRVVFDGTELGALDDRGRAALRRERMGLVFQQFNLVQSLTVSDNVALQARLAGRWEAERQASLLARLGLDGLEARYPEQLSGGQQQRVAIARALVAAPPLLLADEPTGNLDEATGDTVMALMLDLVADAGMALILVTHSARLAAQVSARAHLSGGALTWD